MLYELLEIRRGITAVMGGGGKTTLLRTLGRELTSLGTVILTTSTQIYPMTELCCCMTPDEDALKNALAQQGIVCVGTLNAAGKLSAPRIAFSRLAELADFVIVEADGSKGRPVKAHLPFEPVLPPDANQTVCVVGMSAMGERIADCAHRPELYAALANASPDDILTPELAARVLNRERLHTRVLLNQTHSVEEYQLAAQLAQCLPCPVAAGSLQKGIIICLS